jgi:excisionase family DNA binding protein
VDRAVRDEPLETVESLAAYLHVATSWVYSKAESGELPSLKVGRYRRFRRSEVNAWLEAGRK